MPGKIFVNYRRDDDPNGAARLRDGLAAKFGKPNVFMDVDNLLAGQRFAAELAKALDACDMLIAVIGPRWLELLKAKVASGERDYVREEIAAALKRNIVVIPVRVGREGSMAPLPRADDLPEDIRDLVDFQKHDVAYERFGRDIAELIEAIATICRTSRSQRAAPRVPWGWVGATAASVLAIGYVGAAQLGVPVPWFVGRVEPARPDAAAGASNVGSPSSTRPTAADAARAKAAADRLAAAEDDARAKAAEEAARRVPQPGQTFRDCSDGCPEMVVVPAGSFTMGSNEAVHEKPPHTVTIAKPFAVGKFEVTFDEWAACVAGGGCASNRSPSDQGWGKGRRPVINVSWNDAKEYVAWLSRKTAKTYRLLSEAEWEYAARAGTTTRYSFGDTITKQQAQFSEGSYGSAKQTVEVGRFPANKFGLFDMHGNVWEWCEDNWHPNYQGAPGDGSVWRDGDASSRVLRGGSWGNGPDDLRSSHRYGYLPDFRFSYVGFRLARTL